VSVVGLKSLDVSPRNELLLLPMIIKNYLAGEYFFTHKLTFVVHYRTGSPGQLGLRVTKCDPVPSLVDILLFFGHVARLDDDTVAKRLFSSTSTYRSTDLLTARGVAHLVVHGTSSSTSYETIPPVRLETSGGVLSTVDMVVQRRDGPRRLRDHDDDKLAFHFHISESMLPKIHLLAYLPELPWQPPLAHSSPFPTRQ